MASSDAPVSGSHPAGQSSRIKRIPKFFAEHKRDQVQAFAYNNVIHELVSFETSGAFIKFLEVPQKHLQSQPPRDTDSAFTFDNFLQAANLVATRIKNRHFTDSPLLVFKLTENRVPLGHVTDARCRPDYTAAFDKHWGKDGVTFWPCIRLAGKKASKGKSKESQTKQAISYLHYLLLVRPDLHVAQGLLTTETSITFLLGIGGVGLRSFEVPWGVEVYKVAYAFFYRLYDPGKFADRAYRLADSILRDCLNLDFKMAEDVVVPYDVDLEITATGADGVETETTSLVVCEGFVPIYASNPFETRTHVLSNPSSELKIRGQPLTVLKDQMCRLGIRFNEHAILDAVHLPEEVPGVVQMVYHRKIDSPYSNERGKYLTGLRQSGRPFLSIQTLQEMLETTFDTLEVLRFLRYERQILHRDISKGNVMYVEEATEKTTTGAVDSGSAGAEEVPLCFIKYLLGESNDPRKTSVLLIDFNYAEHLVGREGHQHERIPRTGTPLFMARAIEFGNAVPFPVDRYMAPIPHSPDCYASKHPDRIKKFPPEKAKYGVEVSSSSANREWRHELDHDAESVFWLLFFWSMSVQPVDKPKENIDTVTWDQMIGDVNNRNCLILAPPLSVTHSFYEPLWPLLRELCGILRVDRHWLDKSETRNSAEYINEAFQRLILQFILDNSGEEFMQHKVEASFREVKKSPQAQTRPCTNSQASDAMNRKRSSSQAPTQQCDVKRHCRGSRSISGKSRGSGGLGSS